MLDYHIHTPLCRHARGTPAAMVRAAVDKGLREIAFLDHLTLPPLPLAHTMTAKDLPFYLNTLRELATAWEGRIRVLAGLEVDFHPESLPEIRHITNSFDLDLVGGSVHFVKGHNIASRKGRESWAALPPLPMYHDYLDSLEALVDADCCDLLCHLDLMEKFSPRLSPAERKEITLRMEDLLDAIVRKNLVVEVNGSGMEHPMQSPYPSPALLQRCREKGIPVTLASDAHTPESVGGCTPLLIQAVRAAGYTEVTGFYRRKRHFLPLGTDRGSL